MAFQPVIDSAKRRVYAYEALVRGPTGQPAASVLDQVPPAARYNFDQACRGQAIALASRLGVVETGASLSLNFMPGARDQPAQSMRSTVAVARQHGIPPQRLILEMTEKEDIADHAHLQNTLDVFRRLGLRIALDDFGAGYAGLALLARLQPDVVKVDMSLVRGLDGDHRRHAVVEGVVSICRRLAITVIAEGVETRSENGCPREHRHHLDAGLFVCKAGPRDLAAAKPVGEACKRADAPASFPREPGTRGPSSNGTDALPLRRRACGAAMRAAPAIRRPDRCPHAPCEVYRLKRGRPGR